MRIIIAEDEPKSRDGLIHVIERFTDYEIAGVANNGEEGYRLTRERKPDLVISDIKMPVLDGLGMLQKIKDSGISTHVILLTGYSEFEYARRALQLQVVEYLLKPLEIDQLLSVLKKIEGIIKKNREERFTPDQLLWSYCLGRKEEKERIAKLLEEELGINDRVISALFLIHPESLASETYGEIQKQLQHSLETLCMENYYFFIKPGEYGGVFVLLVDTERNRNLKPIFTSRILPKLQEISSCLCSMAKIRGIRSIDMVIKKLETLLSYSFSAPEGTIMDEEAARAITYESVSYPVHLENEMIQCIRNGKKEKIIEVGEEFIKQVIDSHASPECIRDYTIRMAVGIFRVAGEIRGSFNQADDLPYYMRGVNQSLSKRKVRYQFEKMIKNVALLDPQSEECITDNGIVLNAITYIQENYAENIGLMAVAQFCNVRPEYLSRIFKEETGVKFVDFLSNFRISTAKRLLTSGHFKVWEVAEKVGFADQKYFYKVFKKTCGVTPMEYKKEKCR